MSDQHPCSATKLINDSFNNHEKVIQQLSNKPVAVKVKTLLPLRKQTVKRKCDNQPAATRKSGDQEMPDCCISIREPEGTPRITLKMMKAWIAGKYSSI
jgi:hypothetical protein